MTCAGSSEPEPGPGRDAVSWDVSAGPSWAGPRSAWPARSRMLVFPQWQTVPFHWIWITVTLLYGFRRWPDCRPPATCSRSSPSRRSRCSGPGRARRAVRDPADDVRVPRHGLARAPAPGRGRRAAPSRRARARVHARRGAHAPHAADRRAGPCRARARRARAGHARPTTTPTVMLDELRRLARISDQLLLLGTVGHADALLLAPVVAGRLRPTPPVSAGPPPAGRAVGVEAPEPVRCSPTRSGCATPSTRSSRTRSTRPRPATGSDRRPRARTARGARVADTGMGVAAADRELDLRALRPRPARRAARAPGSASDRARRSPRPTAAP